MSRSRGVPALLALVSVAATAVAQDPVFDEVALRVVSAESGDRFVVDRGSFDRIEVGDRVVLHPRDGRAYYAAIVSVTERSAVIELANSGAPVVAGTRGVVMVPTKRRGAAQPEPKPRDPADPGAEPPPDPDLPPARGGVGDDGWRPGMPLLGSAYAQKPEQRSARATGRTFAAVDLTRTLDTFTHSFLRVGGDVEIDNLFGDGETLRAAGELNYLTEANNETDGDLRVYELSYAQGGTRFRPLRWQVGRFRQEGLPELGILDGVEVIQRLDSGLRIGGSIGYLPELDDDLESLADLQVAAFARWSPDLTEQLVIGAGVQKTWHRGEADRDLVIARVDWVPPEGVEVHGSFWFDVYDGDDALKNETIALTRGYAFVGQRYGVQRGYHLTWFHEEYPQTLRQDFTPPVLAQNIANAHKDQFSLHAFTGDVDARWRMRATWWIDEERSGGGLEVAREFGSHWRQGDRLEITGLASEALDSTQMGGRITYGRDTAIGRWDAFYELLWVHFQGFDDDRDDMLQHRVRGLFTRQVAERMVMTLYADFGLWDDASTISLGCYLQRNF